MNPIFNPKKLTSSAHSTSIFSIFIFGNALKNVGRFCGSDPEPVCQTRRFFASNKLFLEWR